MASIPHLAVVAVLIVGAAAFTGDLYTFEQRVNHFDAHDERTFAQRYTVNTTFAQPGGPVFFFLAGEAPMEFFDFQEVQIVENWAKRFGAAYVVLEHRFYGESNPLPGYSTANLRYLSKEQALEDAAHFVRWFHHRHEHARGPWVVFGCSYSAALSAWFREKHPDLVIASVAPSGPVEAQLDFKTYFGQFSRSAAPACVEAVRAASEEIYRLTRSVDGRRRLSEAFSTCEPVTKDDVVYFLWSVMGAVGSADQMDNPPSWGLNTTCSILTRKGSSHLQNMVDAVRFNMQPEAPAMLRSVVPPTVGAPENCLDMSEESFIAQMKNSTNSDRSWYHQKCTEFGFFKTSYPGTSAFFPDIPIDHLVSYCSRIFGIPHMEPDVAATNAHYGGYHVRASRVLFTNGLLDPWHLLSVNKNDGRGMHGVQAVTYEAGHCATLIRETASDPPSLTKARAAVGDFLEEALRDAQA